MSFFDEKYILKKLEENLNYLKKVITVNNIKEINKDSIHNVFLDSLYYCNKLNLNQEREYIIKLIYKLGYNYDIKIKMIIDKPYLYTESDKYYPNSYFTGYFLKDILCNNHNFNYRYQYDKYTKTNEYFKNNKENIDFVIRSYKDILLDTNDKNLKSSCVEKINNIFENYNLIDYIESNYIRLIEMHNYSSSDLVSIILTSYNQNNYIEDAISSVLNQTY